MPALSLVSPPVPRRATKSLPRLNADHAPDDATQTRDVNRASGLDAGPAKIVRSVLLLRSVTWGPGDASEGVDVGAHRGVDGLPGFGRDGVVQRLEQLVAHLWVE